MKRKYVIIGLITVCAAGWVFAETAAPERTPRQTYVDLWLESLAEREPAEHDRLMQLRRDDPAAFRLEMQQQVRRARLAAEHRPAAERGPAPQRDRRGPMRSDAPAHDPELRGLIRQYRTTTDEAEREEVKERIEERLHQQFDKMIRDQEAELSEAEQHLTQLRTLLEQQKNNRDQWVGRRLQMMTLP
jgi:hypothetical protein